MKKIMKLSLCKIAIIMVSGTLLLGMQMSANNDSDKHIEVVFESNSIFSDEAKNAVVASFENNENESETYGLVCTLFGHKYETEYVTVIEHEVRTNDPRCQEYVYKTCSTNRIYG